MIEQLCRQINSIQAHYCPVLILQKTIRMWLVQIRLKKFLSTSEK